MRKLISNYTLTLVGIIITLVLETIANFALRLSIGEQFIIISIGVMVSYLTAVIEREAPLGYKDYIDPKIQELRQMLELYSLITEISDSSLQSEVYRLARQLRSGEIPPHLAAVRAVPLINQASKRVLASDYCDNIEHLYRWSHASRLRTWYESNISAMKAGVEVQRIFILSRNEVVKDDRWDSKALEILSEQHRDGVKVYVLWIEDVTGNDIRPQRNVLTDMIVFDEFAVIETTKMETHLFQAPSPKVQEYIETWHEQKKYAREFNDLLAESRR